MNDEIISSIITIIGMLGTSIISYLVTRLTIINNHRHEIDKLKINFEDKMLENSYDNLKQVIFEYLSIVPKCYYYKNEKSYTQYLSSYGKIIVICSNETYNVVSEIHKIIINAESTYRKYDKVFENLFTCVALKLGDDLRNAIPMNH